MITQTLALLLDAYRELNARKMFWISVILSALVVVVFALMTVNERGVHVMGVRVWSMTTSAEVTQGELLLAAFLTLGMYFLTLVAVVLAVVSTSSIFPDFLGGGSIDLYLSKPIGRLRLFLTKYVSGLLFVALQISAFCLASFLLIGIRGKLWLPGVFLGIPLVVCYFSYLWGVSVLVGVLTRSTLAAILLTFLFWLAVFGLHGTEFIIQAFRAEQKVEARHRERRIQMLEGQIGFLMANPTEPNAATKVAEKTAERDRLRSEMKKGTATLDRAARVVYVLKTPLPKTSETVGLIERWVGKAVETERVRLPAEPDLESRRGREEAMGREMQRVYEARSPGWIIGTSLTFEAVLLSIAAWVFCRRDY